MLHHTLILWKPRREIISNNSEGRELLDTFFKFGMQNGYKRIFNFYTTGPTSSHVGCKYYAQYTDTNIFIFNV